MPVAVFRIVIVAPGTAAPDGSVTVPVMVPEPDTWAHAVKAARAQRIKMAAMRWRVIFLLANDGTNVTNRSAQMLKKTSPWASSLTLTSGPVWTEYQNSNFRRSEKKRADAVASARYWTVYSLE